VVGRVSQGLGPGRFAIIAFGLVVWPSVAGAQRLRTVAEARGRVFPSVGAGVIALRRDSAGRYYILARPAATISVYGPDGTLVTHIPNAASGAAIHYAADFDLTPGGLVAVADRGANAVEVFRSDGALVSRIPVVASTSVAALSDTEFAVTTLTSKRRVEVIDERGEVLRSFGDPDDVAESTIAKPFTTLERSPEIPRATSTLPSPRCPTRPSGNTTATAISTISLRSPKASSEAAS
jgi:hypothetical protein